MTLCILADRIHNIPDWRKSSKPWAISQNHVPVANGCFPHVSQFYPRPLLFTPLRFLGFIVFLSTTWTRQQSPVSTAPTPDPCSATDTRGPHDRDPRQHDPDQHQWVDPHLAHAAQVQQLNGAKFTA